MNLAPDYGQSAPLGATLRDGGVNFSLFSRHASGVTLLLFDAIDGIPVQSLPLDPVRNRTYHYWHLFVPNIQPGQLYCYRVDGPHEPEHGLRFDQQKVLLDPYGREVVVPTTYGREAAALPGDNAATAMKNVVFDPRAYDWE